MKLIPVATERPEHWRILWDLLSERPGHANISHREMPSWSAHVIFVHDHPYRAWNLIEVSGEIIGAIYLTMQNEIGIGIFKAHQGKGYGPAAIKRLMEEYGPRRFLANIAPGNEASRKVFEGMGFKHIQNTFELEAK